MFYHFVFFLFMSWIKYFYSNNHRTQEHKQQQPEMLLNRTEKFQGGNYESKTLEKIEIELRFSGLLLTNKALRKFTFTHTHTYSYTQ